jgi:hypothetical protein
MVATSETFKVRARKGDVSFVESSLGYFEVWAVDGSQGEPKRFHTWDEAVEAFEYAVAESKAPAPVGHEPRG